MRTLTTVLLLVMAGFVVSGCSSVRWYNPDKTLKQAKRDCQECYDQARVEAIAEAAHYKHKYGYQGSTGRVYRNVQFNRCMKQKGYSLVPEDELSPTVRKQFFSAADDHSSLLAGK